MENKKINLLFVSTKTGSEECCLDKNWDAFREKLGFRMLEPVYFTKDNITYEVLADEEGLLKGQPQLTVYLGPEHQIFGNVLIARYNVSEGTDESLTEDDYAMFKQHLRQVTRIKQTHLANSILETSFRPSQILDLRELVKES